MVSMLGAFAGAGVLSGLASGMEHERNLQEALDTNYQTVNTKEAAEEKLQSAKYQDEARYKSSKAQDSVSGNYLINATEATKSANAAGDQANQAMQAPGAQPVPGAPASMAAPGVQSSTPIQPQTPPLTAPIQGQGQIQAQNLPPVNAQPAAQSTFQAPNSKSDIIPPTPQPTPTAPDPADVHPTSPAGQITAATQAKDAIVSQDPHKLAALNAATFPDSAGKPTIVPQVVEAYNKAHAAYPAIPPEQLTPIINQFADKNVHLYDGDFTKLYTNLDKLNEQAVKAQSTAPVLLNDAGISKRAQDFGVPAYKDSVFFSLPEKQQEAEFNNQQKVFQKDYDSNVPNIKDGLQHLDKITGLLGNVQTGDTAALPGSVKFRTAVDSNAAELDKEFNYMTLRSKPSSGYSRVTNADLMMFQKSAPNFSIPNDANYAIAAGMKAQKQDELEYYNFKQSWLDAYHHIDNAMVNKAWDNYKDNNPIFDPSSKPNNPILNANRLSPTEYFAGKSMDDILKTQSNATANNSASVTNSQNPTQTQSGKAPDFSNLWK